LEGIAEGSMEGSEGIADGSLEGDCDCEGIADGSLDGDCIGIVDGSLVGVQL
jgi:hypothetical protein